MRIQQRASQRQHFGRAPLSVAGYSRTRGSGCACLSNSYLQFLYFTNAMMYFCVLCTSCETSKDLAVLQVRRTHPDPVVRVRVDPFHESDDETCRL